VKGAAFQAEETAQAEVRTGTVWGIQGQASVSQTFLYAP
jgi:hypothetical protein